MDRTEVFFFCMHLSIIIIIQEVLTRIINRIVNKIVNEIDPQQAEGQWTPSLGGLLGLCPPPPERAS